MKTSPCKRKKLTTFVIQNSEVLIVVPAYNEAVSIARVISGIHAAGFSCVVVDDGSEDDTSHIAKKLVQPFLRFRSMLELAAHYAADFVTR